MNARQMGGQRAAIGCGASRRARAPPPGSVLSSSASLAAIACSISSSARRELLRIELLRAPAKLHAPQLLQQVLQAVILRQRLVALGNRRVPLRQRRREQRLQHCDIGWEADQCSRSRATLNQIRAQSCRAIAV